MSEQVIPLRAAAPPSPVPRDAIGPLAEALAEADIERVGDLIADGRMRLQAAVVEELHSLVGALVTAISRAETLEDKVRCAVGIGVNFMALRPPDRIIVECADPGEVVEILEAACAGVRTFLAAELVRALRQEGPAAPVDAQSFVDEAVRRLAAAVDEQERGSADVLPDLLGELVSDVEAMVTTTEVPGQATW